MPCLKVERECTTSSDGLIIFGYDIGISGGITFMNTFLQKFFPKFVPLYLSDMASAKLRGNLNIAFHLMIIIGNLINYSTNKIEGGWGWGLGLGLVVVPAI
ncbi:hypothetical protein OPV22_029227 [Ensete ventricosum]|uniref:Major facilitator superfamily (MFS) profile domain-containing protein n=1 Tax=Ensete ventricosum TaxID=4639 RepID=A0AAV8Q553_ENSVE|nr:hypothetical protein OPV22_029227 [Ensete ventricosum]